MRFRVDDRVKILPSATQIGVEEEEVGKFGVISHIESEEVEHYGIVVQMNEICKARGYIPSWSVDADMIRLLHTKGKQLLFSFME